MVRRYAQLRDGTMAFGIRVSLKPLMIRIGMWGILSIQAPVLAISP